MDRSDRLEARLDRAVLQQREMREKSRKDLKRLRMSLDGVPQYYRVQRRLIDQRLLVLESGRDRTEVDASIDDKSRAP